MKRHTLHEQRWQDGASARSLLLTVLGEYVYPADRAIWTRTFVEAHRLLGFGEATTRQALRRSAAAGWLASERRGRQTLWHLTETTRRILASGSERIYSFGRARLPWCGEWQLLLINAPEERYRLRHPLRRRLAWAGFGSLGHGLWICPNTEREAEAAEILRTLGLEDRAHSFRGQGGALGGTRQLVQRAWDLGAIAERHRAFLQEARGRGPRGAAASFVALTRLVHRWRSLPFVDPDLPSELLPERWIGHRAAERFHQLHRRWTASARSFWTQLSAGDGAAV